MPNFSELDKIKFMDKQIFIFQNIYRLIYVIKNF